MQGGMCLCYTVGVLRHFSVENDSVRYCSARPG